MIGSNQFGVIVVKAVRRAINANYDMWQFKITGDPLNNVFVMPITSFAELRQVNLWKCMVLSPMGMMKLSEGGYRGNQSYMVAHQLGVDPLVASCKLGFKGVSGPHLTSLMTLLGMKFKANDKPTTVPAQVTALIKKLIPDATEEFIATCLEARGSAPKQNASSTAVFSGLGNLEKIETGLDHDDMKIVKEGAMQINKGKKSNSTKLGASVTVAPKGGVEKPAKPGAKEPAKPGPKTAAEAAESALEPEPKKKAWKLRDPPEGEDDISAESVQMYKPGAKGCYLVRETTHGARWIGSYPDEVPPFSYSKTWGPVTGLSSAEALSLVLNQLWAWHTTATGEENPFAFQVWKTDK